MVKITYFVHGTTVDNLNKKATGWLPGELSQKGIEQAKNLNKIIKDKYFDVVICSDLKRAIDSAKIDFEGRDIKIIQDPRIRECNYGDLDGKDNFLVDYSQHIYNPFPNGESLKDVEVRLKNFIEYLKQNFNNKKVALVSHKAPQFAFEVLTKNKTWEDALKTDWRLTGNWQPGWEYIIK